MALRKVLALGSDGIPLVVNDPDQIQVPAGSASAPGIVFGSATGFFNDTTNIGIGISIAGAQVGWFAAGGPTYSLAGGGALQLTVQGEGATTVGVARYANSASAPNLLQNKARGTIASPLVPVTNDNLGAFNFRAWTGAAFTASCQILASLTETSTVDTTHIGGQIRISACPIGSGTLTEIARLDNASGLSMFGANPVIDNNRLLRWRIFTVATLPTAIEGGSATVSDATLTAITGLGLAPIGGGANHVPVYADNVGWKIL